MSDSSITAIQSKWYAGFIIAIIATVVMNSCDHIIKHALI